MASRVNVCSVNVLNNPAKFGDPFKLEVTFEAFEALPDDLDWELVYVGAAESEKYDQVLDSVLVGPVIEGRHKFVFEADAPDPTKIPNEEIVGVTVLLLRCSYHEQQFIKIGWFVANEYEDPELKETPPQPPLLDKLVRTVCTDDVRVTTFAVKWEETQEEEYPPEEEEVTGQLRHLSTEEPDPRPMEFGGGDAGNDAGGDDTNQSEAMGDGDSSPSKGTQNGGTPLLDVTNESIPDLVD